MPHLGSFLPLLAVGFVTAAIVGWFAIRWLLNYLNRHSLYVFAAYCAIVAVILVIVQVFSGIVGIAWSSIYDCQLSLSG